MFVLPIGIFTFLFALARYLKISLVIILLAFKTYPALKRFLLIDDHEIIRAGIKVLLSDIYNPSEIDEANNGESALYKIRASVYDLIILDAHMPDTDTLGLMEYIKIKYPVLSVLIFSMSPENIYTKRFLKAGAKGFINKDAPLDEIKKAIDMVLNNKKYVSESMLEILAEDSGKEKENNVFNTLSTREFEILTLLLSGQTISKIAGILHLGVSTIGTHKGRIFKKLNVGNLLELKELANTYSF